MSPFIVWTSLTAEQLSAVLPAAAWVVQPLPPGRYVVQAASIEQLRAVAGVDRVAVDPVEHLLPRD